MMLQHEETDYRLILLGKPAILVNGVSVKVPRTKCKGIIFYLAAQNKDISRERLQDIFWPELEQHNLNVHLSSIRKQLPGLLESDGAYVRLSKNVSVDCRQFDSYFDAGQFEVRKHQTILKLYRGDFLEGLSISASDEFDDWKTMMQEHYLSTFIKGLLQLADHHHKRGEYQEELAVLQNALQIDPLQENIYRSVMRLHYENGDFLQANAIYQKLQKVLIEEIGTSPMPETQQLYKAMLEHTPIFEDQIHSQRQHFTLENDQPSHRKSLAEQDFVGMERLLARIYENIAAGKVSILHGLDGSGKTRVLQKLTERWNGYVIWVRGELALADIAYLPVIYALTDFFAAEDGAKAKLLERLSPQRRQCLQTILEEGQAAVEPAQESVGKAQLFETLTGVLSQLGPVLLLADDLDQADQETIRLLQHLILCCRGKLSFVGTSSPLYAAETVPMIFAALSRNGILDNISMPGFEKADVAALLDATAMSVQKQEPLVEWLWKIAGKNPYQLMEMLKILPEFMGADGKVLSLESPKIPANMRTYYNGLLLGLSDTAKAVLNVAAVYGTVFPFSVILNSHIVEETACLDGLDELLQKEIFQSVGSNEYTFFTVVMRETAYAVISPSRRQYLHLRIAEAMEAVPDSADQELRGGLIAHHFAKSSHPKRAVPYAIEAGDAAYMHSAWMDAIDYYEMARKYSDDSDFLFRYLTAAYLSAGEIMEYLRLCQERSEKYKQNGDREKYLSNELEMRFSQKDSLEEYRWGVVPSYFTPCDEEEAQLLQDAKAQLEQEITDKYYFGRLCMVVGIRCASNGDFVNAAKYFMKIVENNAVFESTEEQSVAIMAHLCAGAYLGAQGNTGKAIEVLRTGLADAVNQKIIYAEAIIRCEYGKQLALSGAVDQAVRQLGIALKLSQNYRMVYVEARTLLELGKIELHTSLEDALKKLRQALQLTETTNNCQHLQIQILNELYPYMDQDEKGTWDKRLVELDHLTEAKT